MIHSKELEKNLLAALLRFPTKYVEIASFIDENDFYTQGSIVHQTLFKVLKTALESGEAINDVILAERVKSFVTSFEDNIDITDYIKSLALIKVADDSVVALAKELKKHTIRREIYNSSLKVAEKMKKLPRASSFDEIISTADTVYNAQINPYLMKDDSPQNIFDKMEEMVEDRGENPEKYKEVGFMSPHPRLNQMYGSLLRPGNITVIVARSGVGKTSFCLDFATKVSLRYENTPVLHFDNGEMSETEVIMRQCASLSGVPLNFIESGKWRENEDYIKRIRATWPKIKSMKFYYYNVAGLNADAMLNIIRRFYYSKVGRGNKMIFSFDYIKTAAERSGNKSSWELVGEMVNKFKQIIHKEILFDDEPMISMLTSVQSNRYGITNNRNSDSIVEDESIVALSDQITQYCSHMFILRQKTLDEIQSHPPDFGSHKLTCVKYRHLGEDIHRALQPVEWIDGSKQKNAIFLDFNNFDITEKGDLQDLASHLSTDLTLDSDPLDLL